MERTVNDSRDTIAVGELSKVEAAIADLRAKAQGEDVAAIKAAIETLQHASHAIAETLYRGSQASQGSQGSQGPHVKDAEVVDAEYAETA